MKNETNKIAIYAICKNELQFVDAWVKSMSEADCIVVLDTGSTDGTYEKLLEYSDKFNNDENLPEFIVDQKIYDKWRFDIPRNDSLSLIPEKYNILMSTDLDELLKPGWGNILRERWIEGKHERAIYKYVWSHLENGDDGRIFGYDKVHSRNWIWKYPVHELLWNTKTNTNLYGEDDQVLNVFNEIRLDHYPDMTKSRGSYLPLLELRAKENPHDYYGLFYLAHEYYYRNHWNKSIKTCEYLIENFQNEFTPSEKANAYLFMGDSYMKLHNIRKSTDSYLKAIDIDPTYREPYLNLAKALMEEDQYEVAETYLKIGLKKSYRHYLWIERDISWTYEPYDLLSLACFYSGKKRDSLAYAYKAYSMDHENVRLRDNIDSILNNMTEEEFLK